MAEFVKKDDGTNVRLKVRKQINKAKGITLGDPGLVAYIKSIKTNYEGASAGHLVDLQIFVHDSDLARASGFAPHIYNGAKIQITLVNGGVAIPVEGPSETASNPDDDGGDETRPRADEDSEPASEREHEEDYEEETEGPPPVIPPTSEPGATEKANQDNDKNKAEGGQAATGPPPSDFLDKITEIRKRLEGR